MGLLKQAAERNSIHQALYLMMKATPPGVAVNWVAVRTKLQDFIAKLSTPPGVVAFIAQAQVSDGIFVLTTIELHFISGKISFQSMVIVEHTGDAIESETVEVKFCEPKVYIG